MPTEKQIEVAARVLAGHYNGEVEDWTLYAPATKAALEAADAAAWEPIEGYVSGEVDIWWHDGEFGYRYPECMRDENGQWSDADGNRIDGAYVKAVRPIPAPPTEDFDT